MIGPGTQRTEQRALMSNVNAGLDAEAILQRPNASR